MDGYTISHVEQAFELNAITVRKWLNHAENPLRVNGVSDGGGKWRRYDLADLTRFALLAYLIRTLKIDTEASIKLVNALFDEITDWTAAAIGAAQVEKSWRLVERRWFLIRMMTDGYIFNSASFQPGKSLGELLDSIKGGCYPAIVFDLTAMVMSATASTGRIKFDPDDADANG